MLSEGSVVYFGTPVESLDYLRGLELACPDGYNAADHWMDLLVIDSALEEEHDDLNGDLEHHGGSTASASNADGPTARAMSCVRRRKPRETLQEAWNGEAVATEMDSCVVRQTRGDNAPEHLEKFNKYSTGWTTQYYILMHRALKNSRSAIFTPLNLVKSVAIGIVAGILWFQMDYTERNVNDIRSFQFFVSSSLRVRQLCYRDL